MRRIYRLLDRLAPLRAVGGLRATLDGEPWAGEIAWQLNGPSYTVPGIEGRLMVWQRYERRWRRLRFDGRDVLILMWMDGTDARAWLQGGVLVP